MHNLNKSSRTNFFSGLLALFSVILFTAFNLYVFFYYSQNPTTTIDTRPPSSLSINTPFSTADVKDKKFFYLMPTVTLANNDEQSSIYLKLDNDSLKITRIVVKGDKVKGFETITPESYQDITNDSVYINDTIIIPKSSDRQINYAAQLDTPGLYFVTFTAETMDSKGELLNRQYMGKPTKLFISKYVYVK